MATSLKNSLLPHDERRTPRQEVFDLCKQAVPNFLTSMSYVLVTTVDTALIGHTGVDNLAATAQSDFWTGCSTPFMSNSVLSTFAGQAKGVKNHKMVGVWTQISILNTVLVAIPVAMCWLMTERVLLMLGRDPSIAEKAGYFSGVLVLAFPPRILFRNLSSFFTSQKILYPGKNSAVLALTLNTIFGLYFVLGLGPLSYLFGNGGLGFEACPWVTVCVEWTQITFFIGVYMYILGLHKECWHGIDFSEITFDRWWEYFKLYFPAALALCSDFWRMAMVGAMAAWLGDEQVAIFNANYRVLWLTLGLVGAFNTGMTTNMNLALGHGDVQAAQQSVRIGFSIVAALILFAAVGFNMVPHFFASIFSSDEHYIKMSVHVAPAFSLVLISMVSAVALERVIVSFGKTKQIFYMGVCASWLVQVPAVYFIILYTNSLNGLYYGVALGYATLAALSKERIIPNFMNVFDFFENHIC